MITITDETQAMIDEGCLVVVNHSGGKDSQAMLALVAERVPRKQILVIHAHLEGVEWDGTWDKVKETADAWGAPAICVQAKKTFFEMVKRRGM